MLPGDLAGCGVGLICVCGRRRRWLSLIVLVFSPMLQDACELHVVEVGLLVDGGLPHQLVDLLVREAVAHGGQELPQVVLLDEA